MAGLDHGGVSMPRMAEDVVQVVGAVEAVGGIGIAGRAVSAGMHEVVV